MHTGRAKRLLALLLALLLLLATGCARYAGSDEKRLVKAGRTLMADHLAANVPGARCLRPRR